MDDEYSDDEEHEWKCAGCQRRINLGADLIAVEEGVLGPRGVVPLEPVQCFCSTNCVAHFYANGTEHTQLPRRIP